MTEHVFRADRQAPEDVSATPFAGLDIRTLIGSPQNGAELANVGQTIYPAGRHGHEAHSHPNAEEVLVVLAGSGCYQVGDDVFEISTGDVVFVPRGAVHATTSSDDEDLVTLWMLGGAGSLAAAGYESRAADGRL